MSKKIIIALICLISIITISVFATELQVLPDNDERVEILKEQKILIGDEKGNLNLDSTLKRQEMVVLISRLMDVEEEAKNWNVSKLTFKDVKKDNWAAPYIAWAKDNDITKGYSEEWFGYNDSLTTTQTQIFLLRVLGYEAEMENANELALEAGLMEGITNPESDNIIRSDVAIMLYNTLYGTQVKVSELEKMINQINEKSNIGLASLATNVIDIKDSDLVTFFTGLKSNENVEELVVSEPMMSSQAYSLVLAKVKDGANIESMKKEMLDNIDTRKWICVEAEKVYVTNNNNLICLIMTNEEAANTVLNSFKEIVNGETGKVLERSTNQ